VQSEWEVVAQFDNKEEVVNFIEKKEGDPVDVAVRPADDQDYYELSAFVRF
jgi:hypothetical protein